MFSKLQNQLNRRGHRDLNSPASRTRLAAAYFPAAALCAAASIWSTAIVGADDQPAKQTPEKPAAVAEQKASEGFKAPEGLKPIGGRWYVKEGDRPVYYYKDADRYLDLFSYHAKDSNKDGIENVRLSHDNSYLIMRSQGYPNHPTAVFPNSDNPNTIKVQDFTFRFPLAPKLANKITRLPMGPIGAALNGVVFFNPFEAEGMNAVEGYSEVWLDSCCGHPQQTGVYHYHKYPSCVKSPFPDDGHRHSPVIGFAFDGFPIYGPYESDGVLAKDLTSARALDVCNGHEDPERGYHYHVTPGRFPYIVGGYAGVVEASNSRGLRRSSEGAIENNAQPGENRMDKVIVAVRPGTAARGATHSIQIELQPDKAQRRPVPRGVPSWAQLGPYEAKKISRDGDVVTVEIEIPDDATLGILLDCHIEFEGRPAGSAIGNAAGNAAGGPAGGPPGRRGRGGPIVYKKNDAFRVTE